MKGIAALGAFLAGAGAYAQDETVGVRLREWRATMEGHIQAQGDSIPSTNVDLDRELGIDDPENVHEIQAYVGLPLLGSLYAGWWFGTYEGDRFVTQTFTFADRVFTAGTTVTSELELDVYYLSFEIGLPTLPLGDLVQFKAGVLPGVRVFHAEGEIENEFFTGQDSGTIGLPVIGVHAALQVTPYARADVEVMGMAFKYGNSSGRYIEAFIEVVGQVGPAFGGVGYKFVDLDLADHRGDTDFDLAVDITGPYLTVGVRF
jgi:hypothetical protein